MHCDLRDQYRRLALFMEWFLLVASVVFCATTFVDDSLYVLFDLKPQIAKVGLGFASIGAFAAALTLMLADFRGKSERHREAADQWTTTLKLFRDARNADGTWAPACSDPLSDAYWAASIQTVPIPDRRFNNLKSRYLLKVAMSQMIERHPGAPRWFVWLIIRVRGCYRIVTATSRSDIDR